MPWCFRWSEGHVVGQYCCHTGKSRLITLKLSKQALICVIILLYIYASQLATARSLDRPSIPVPENEARQAGIPFLE